MDKLQHMRADLRAFEHKISFYERFRESSIANHKPKKKKKKKQMQKNSRDMRKLGEQTKADFLDLQTSFRYRSLSMHTRMCMFSLLVSSHFSCNTYNSKHLACLYSEQHVLDTPKLEALWTVLDFINDIAIKDILSSLTFHNVEKTIRDDLEHALLQQQTRSKIMEELLKWSNNSKNSVVLALLVF